VGLADVGDEAVRGLGDGAELGNVARLLAPISMMAMRCSGFNFNRVSGTPMWLLRLPSVANVARFAPNTAWANSLVVVLPLVPVMPITGMSRVRRCSQGKLLQRLEHIGHRDEAFVHRHGGIVHHGMRASVLQRLRSECIRVEVGAAKCEEDAAGQGFARVRANAGGSEEAG
jgi:hypothetical protein